MTTAMILAAGRGDRLRPLTDTLPKALVTVAGTSLLERHLQRLGSAGVRRAVINLGWLGEAIVEQVGDGSRFGLQVVYSPEYDEVLETGGGIRRALPLLGSGPFQVLNSDVYSEMPLPLTSPTANCLGHLVLVRRPNYRPRGDFDLVGGKVRRAAHPAYTFSGMAVYRPEFFAGCDEGRFSLAPMLFSAADRGLLSGEIYTGVWEDVGTVERLSRLNESFAG